MLARVLQRFLKSFEDLYREYLLQAPAAAPAVAAAGAAAGKRRRGDADPVPATAPPSFDSAFDALVTVTRDWLDWVKQTDLSDALRAALKSRTQSFAPSIHPRVFGGWETSAAPVEWQTHWQAVTAKGKSIDNPAILDFILTQKDGVGKQLRGLRWKDELRGSGNSAVVILDSDSD